jgi:hypothetical protein
MTALPFKILAEGFVSRRPEAGPTAMAAGARCAWTERGDVVCAFMTQSKFGVNDFKPMLARSLDGGLSWSEAALIWPRLAASHSVFGAVSRAPSGELLFFGARTPIDRPGEPNWCDATQGLKQNALFWARSDDSGVTWTEPQPVPMPFPGAAESACPVCAARDGAWHACYSPYNTFDPAVKPDRNQVVLLTSFDQGNSWRHTAMLRWADPLSTAAEAWVVELADGRLLGTCWNLNQRDGTDFPNAYAVSANGGVSWSPTRSTGILGQSTALCPLPDGRALFVYNQRQHGEPGVWLAAVRPDADGFGIQWNQPLWRAPQPAPDAQGHSEWTSFAFGEPAATVLPGGDILAVWWCLGADGRGIRYARLRLA